MPRHLFCLHLGWVLETGSMQAYTRHTSCWQAPRLRYTVVGFFLHRPVALEEAHRIHKNTLQLAILASCFFFNFTPRTDMGKHAAGSCIFGRAVKTFVLSQAYHGIGSQPAFR